MRSLQGFVKNVQILSGLYDPNSLRVHWEKVYPYRKGSHIPKKDIGLTVLGGWGKKMIHPKSGNAITGFLAERIADLSPGGQ